MEIWLKVEEEEADTIQLPILPPTIGVGLENNHGTVNVQTKGEVTIMGKQGLYTMEISSFFPAHDYPFACYPKDRDPYDYCRKIIRWSEKAVRVTVTGTNINFLAVITSFKYEEDSSGDISYTLSLRKYLKPSFTEFEDKKEDKPKPKPEEKPAEKPSRPAKEPEKTYTVKQGDNLWNLAKKFYGSGSKMSKLYSANKTVIENAAKKHGYASSSHNGVQGWWIFPNTKLVIPK